MLVACLRFPYSTLLGLWRLEDLTLIREKPGEIEIKEGEILVKMEDKAAPNVELGCADRFLLGHCGLGV